MVCIRQNSSSSGRKFLTINILCNISWSFGVSNLITVIPPDNSIGTWYGIVGSLWPFHSELHCQNEWNLRRSTAYYKNSLGFSIKQNKLSSQ